MKAITPGSLGAYVLGIAVAISTVNLYSTAICIMTRDPRESAAAPRIEYVSPISFQMLELMVRA